MGTRVKNILKSFVPQKFKKLFGEFFNNYFDGYAIKSYAQGGEGLILRRIFEYKTTGFYVDVGAHHPFRFSNTYRFYLRGWRGINIDPMPGSMRLFNKFRKRDINLELAVGENEDTLIYYMFNEPALNTFDEGLAKTRDGKNGYYIHTKLPIKVYPLSKILDEYLPREQEIDFLNVDVEGKDFEVIKSNNWNKFRPNEFSSHSSLYLQPPMAYKTDSRSSAKKHICRTKSTFYIFRWSKNRKG
jgi:FkbM family methyltransferase